MTRRWVCVATVLLVGVVLTASVSAFQSDELTEDDDEWGIVGGGVPRASEKLKQGHAPVKSSSGSAVRGAETAMTNNGLPSGDKKIQFVLEHSFGGSEFVPAGIFTARLRETVKGGQTLSKFRLLRNSFTAEEKINFQALLDTDDFYSIRVPANVVNVGKSFAISSVKARCLASSRFQERFDFQMDHGHVIGVTYGSSLSCPYPRVLQTPSKWTFDSLIIVKYSEQPTGRTSLLPDIIELLPEDEKLADDGTIVNKISEKSFWAKYWMYIVPIALIVVNSIMQVANMPEDGAAPGTPVQQRGAIGGGGTRRR